MQTRWLAGALLVGFALYICACNVALVYRCFFHRERHSLVLVFGGLAGAAGLFVLPVQGLHKWFWLPLIADLGIPYLAGFGFCLWKKSFHS